MLSGPGAPADEQALLARARALAGMPLGRLADQLGVALPVSNRSGKGWAGQLLELALGASAGSLSMPDFPRLGIELKSVPVRDDGWPKESTHVCAVPLLPQADSSFEASCVARKLARVLWLPVQAGPGMALAERRIGRAVLWSPDAGQSGRLRADFEELMELVHTGQVARITARHGEVLQIRPKAASAAQLTATLDADGRRVMTNPRGYYLRPSFTAEILASLRRTGTRRP